MKKSNWVAWIGTAAIIAGLATGGWVYFDHTQPQQAAGPPEKLTLAIARTYVGTGLVFVASAKGYLTDAGLDVTLQDYTTGAAALAAAMEGKADLATVAETPLIFAVMRGQPVSIIATICTSRQHQGIVGRKDRGIATAADLSGKRIAATSGTTGHYLLETVLTSNKIGLAAVQMINLKPEQMADAVARGDVDAVSTWEPYFAQAARVLGGNAVVFHAGDLYRAAFNLAGRQGIAAKRAEAIRRLLRALARAEQFVNAKPAEARAIIAQATQIDRADIERIWPNFDLRLSLEQGLITLLEAEARWAIRNALVERPDVPNFLDSLSPEAITLVKPGAVSIIR